MTTVRRHRLLEEWNTFFKACFPNGCSNPVQVREMKKAFFAGAVVTFRISSGLGPDTWKTEEEGFKVLDDLDAELNECLNEWQAEILANQKKGENDGIKK